VGAFRSAREYRQHEFTRIDVDHAKAGDARGERVIGDLRLGRADGGEERRFAGIRQPDDAGIGNEFERSRIVSSVPSWPGIWRAAVRGWSELLKCALPKPPLPPRASTTCWSASARSASNGLAVLLVDLRAGRHFEHDVGAVGTVDGPCPCRRGRSRP